MSIIEKAISAISPKWAWRRTQFREALAAYEAATPSRLRKSSPDNGSGNTVVGKAGTTLRGYARQLEQNYDIAEGILKVLVNNIIGPNGISREPLPKRKDGTLHKEFAKQLLELWKDWVLMPEVTGELDYAAAERLAARTWFRDGELLVQFIEGFLPTLDHGTLVPFSLELIEADQLPFYYTDYGKHIIHGVEANAWGRPKGYHIFKAHPGDMNQFNASRMALDVKFVPADRMLHPKFTTRIKQVRGVSVFAVVMRRLEDLKDYEESERIAARVAAALTGYIKKGLPEAYNPPTDGNTDRRFKMVPGMVFDGLREGEEVGTIDSNRPSGLLSPFHDAMTRFTASGVGAGYSSISKNYNGTYGAQRQELVESYGNYQTLTNLWVGQFSRPVWRRFVAMAVASGKAKVPTDLDMNTLYDAEFRGPAMPWIDPVKEATANKMLERSGYKSAQQIIRERSGNPDDTMEQIAHWQKESRDKQLMFDSNPANDKAQPLSPADAGLSTSGQGDNQNG